MPSHSAVTMHFERLLKIARESRVQVHFLSGQQFPGLDWDGLPSLPR